MSKKGGNYLSANADRWSKKCQRWLDLVNLELKRMNNKERPPGITNEEYKKFHDEVIRIVGEHGQKVRDVIHYYEHLIESNNVRLEGNKPVAFNFGDYSLYYGTEVMDKIRNLLEEIFMINPSKGKAYVNDDYIKTRYFPHISNEDINIQKVKCEICGENRNVDKAHIIPRKVMESLIKIKSKKEIEIPTYNDIRNSFVLCPNHHRFFDRGMLSKIEWEKMPINKKHPLAVSFFNDVLCERQRRFWEEGKIAKDLIILTKDGQKIDIGVKTLIALWVEQNGFNLDDYYKNL